MPQREAASSAGFFQFVNDLAVARVAYRAIAGFMFHRYFNAVAASNDELRSEVFRIRYDVYCAELGYEQPDRFPDKEETDSYDQYSLHCLLSHKGSGSYAGCVRLVRVNPLAPAEPLPFEHHCHGKLDAALLAKLVPDRLKVGEISRLAVRSSFRRRKGEEKEKETIVDLDQALRDAKATTAKERREALRSVRTPWIALGLYLSAAAIGLIKGLDGVFALMQPRLANHLVIHGLNFVQVGEPIEHRGTRAPYFISRADLYAGVAPWIRGLLEVIVSDLRKTGADAMMPTVPRSRRGQASGS